MVIDCDNNGVFIHGNSVIRVLKVGQAQADIIYSLKRLMIEHMFKIEFHWVATHQDKKKKLKDLARRKEWVQQ